ncbi:MAG: hypothetical protein PVF66_08860 [Candidatus Aminicenantes bacterium]
MILIPLVIIRAGLIFFKSSQFSWLFEVSQIIGWFALAVTIWLLLVYVMKSQRRLVTSLFSVIIMVAVCFLSILSYYSLSFPEESLYLLIMFGLGIFIMLIGMIATRFFIRKRNTFKNFILRHPVWHLLISMVTGLIIYFVFSLMGMPTGWAGGILLEGLTVGVGMGIVLYIVLFPFLFIAFFNRIYRGRLESVFGFEKVESGSGSLPGEQKEKIKR